VQWIPESQIVYTTKIVVATVSVFMRAGDNTTTPVRSETVYGAVPSEYSLYSLGTDAQGTAVITLPIPQPDGGTTWSEFTYPTPYIDYATEYRWQGVLQTQDAKFEPICATVSPKFDIVELPKHYEYPQPKGPLSPGRFDPFGSEHKPLLVPIKDEPDKLYFDVAYPSESAFSSCSSVPPSGPLPTEYFAPKFVTEYTTVPYTPSTAGVIVIQPTASGWEETTTTTTRPSLQQPAVPHIPSTADGFEDRTTKPRSGGSTASSVADHIENTATGFGDRPPQAQNTPKPNQRPPSVPDVIVSLINNNPGVFNPAPTAAPQLAAPTPFFTYVPTVINGQSTTIPAYILPGSSATATIGQEVTINGQATVLAAPEAVFTMVPTTINGVATSVPAYIISGTSTAALGETVVLNGQTTILSAPSAVFTYLSTTIGGVATSSPAYIISGSITATIGQTVVLDGTTTVLSVPTSTEDGFGKPVATSFGPAQTGGGDAPGAGAQNYSVSLSALLATLLFCTLLGI
jgi:hypothetical protein